MSRAARERGRLMAATRKADDSKRWSVEFDAWRGEWIVRNHAHNEVASGETYEDAVSKGLALYAPKTAAEDPEVARIQRNMDLLAGVTDDPFA